MQLTHINSCLIWWRKFGNTCVCPTVMQVAGHNITGDHTTMGSAA